MNIGIIITDHNVKEALSIVEFGYIIYNGEIRKSGQNEDNINKFVKEIYLGKVIVSLMPLNYRVKLKVHIYPPGDKS